MIIEFIQGYLDELDLIGKRDQAVLLVLFFISILLKKTPNIMFGHTETDGLL